MSSGRPVVVGVDGSDSSHTAVRWAAQEAVRRQLPLRVVHAAIPTHLPTMRSIATAATVDWKDEAAAIAADGVDEARRSDPTLVVASNVRLNQTPAQALANEAESAELLVLGSRGRGGFGALLLGSTAIQVLQLAACPVVIVRPPDPRAAKGPAAGQIVVGIDGSELSHRAVRFAFEEAASRGIGLTAVHAWSKPWQLGLRSFQTSGGADFSFLEEDAAATLADSLSSAQRDYPDVAVTGRLVEGQPSQALVDFSRGAELLVVGSRGRGGITGLVLGSVSYGVVHRAECPVAVTR